MQIPKKKFFNYQLIFYKNQKMNQAQPSKLGQNLQQPTPQDIYYQRILAMQGIIEKPPQLLHSNSVPINTISQPQSLSNIYSFPSPNNIQNFKPEMSLSDNLKPPTFQKFSSNPQKKADSFKSFTLKPSSSKNQDLQELRESKTLPRDKPSQMPFNLKRAEFKRMVHYKFSEEDDDEPDSKVSNEHSGIGRKIGSIRTITIQSSFINNPYFYHLDHDPTIDQQIKSGEGSSIEDEEIEEKERERLKKKVFTFFSHSDSDFASYHGLLSNLLTEFKSKGQKYVDHDFPANLKSLIGNNLSRQAEWGNCVWLRPDEFYGAKKYEIFQDKIEPNDIQQGELGDCYFLSTLSSLAEWPDRITKVFGTNKVNTVGCYCVKMCEMGEWKEVVIDDCFPCDKFTKKPIFTKGNGNELWVLILEKVWAKVHGSYDAIESGQTRECLHDLTGAPTQFFLTDKKEESDMIWRKLCKAERKQYAMTCGAGNFFSQSTPNMVNSKGIVSSHAYSLLSAHEIVIRGGKEVKLVKLRNPWGKIEWTGDWSDSSKMWTPELKVQLGWENKEDGTFFMSYEDFLQHFTDIQFCYIHDKYNYNNLRVTADPRHAVYFKLRVYGEGKYYITVNQESKRKNIHNPYFRYSAVSIVIAQILPDGSYKYITGNNRADREVWAKEYLTPGEYLVYAKVKWTSGRVLDFVLSSYGPLKTSMKVVEKKDYPNFLEKAFITKAGLSENFMDYSREGEPDCSSVIDISNDGFIFCYYRNMSKRILETEAIFKELQGLKLRKPFRGQSFKLRVMPQQEEIVLLRILPNQDVKQVLSEKVRFLPVGYQG